MKYAAFLLAAFVLPALPAQADLQMTSTRYLCERGIEVPVTYVASAGQGVLTLNLDGHQISLYRETSAEGARYGWPSDGSNYVWVNKGTDAVLSWKVETGAETPVLSNFRQQG